MKRALIRHGQRKLNGFLFDVTPNYKNHGILLNGYSVELILFIFVIRFTIECSVLLCFSARHHKEGGRAWGCRLRSSLRTQQKHAI